MKSKGTFESLASEVYKLYTNKSKAYNNKLSQFTKDIAFNSNQLPPKVPSKIKQNAKYSYMFQQHILSTQTQTSKTVKQMQEIFQDTKNITLNNITRSNSMVKLKDKNNKEINQFLITAKLLNKNNKQKKFSTSSKSFQTNKQNIPLYTKTNNSKINNINTPFYNKINKVKKELDCFNGNKNSNKNKNICHLTTANTTSPDSSNTLTQLNNVINNINNSKQLRMNIGIFKGELSHFLKEDIVNKPTLKCIKIKSEKRSGSCGKKYDNINLKVDNEINNNNVDDNYFNNQIKGTPTSHCRMFSSLSCSPGKDGSFCSSSGSKSYFVKFINSLPKDNLSRINNNNISGDGSFTENRFDLFKKSFININEKDKANVTDKINLFKTQMNLQVL